MNKRLDIGINLINLRSNSKYPFLWSSKLYNFSIIGESNLSRIIDRFKANNTNFENSSIYFYIDFHSKYYFNNEEKTIANCVAILSDFVDGFIFANFTDAQDDIDPILTDRIYSDNQYAIYLAAPKEFLCDEMAELIDYARISGVEGLFISDRTAMLNAGKCELGTLEIFYTDIHSDKDVQFAASCGANRFCITPDFSYYLAFITLRKLSPDILDNSLSE